MPFAPVILNNTPLIAFWLLERLDILAALYGSVLIPVSVRSEFLAVERESRQNALLIANWIQVASPTKVQVMPLLLGLDQGEADVLWLAVELSARLVIIDERRGRRYAQRIGVPTTGTLGVLLASKRKGLIPTVAHPIAILQKAGLHFKAELIGRVLAMAGE